jgi:rhomboid protease GluP
VRERGWFERAGSTRMVLLLNLVVFALGLWLAKSPRALIAMPSHVLYALGMSDALAVFRELRVETLVTSCFVHASLMHLLLNLYVLVQIGPPVERALGSARMAVLYLVGGALGSLASATVGWLGQTERTSEGLSGALCGVIGCALVFGFRTGGKTSPLARSMARWAVLLAAIQVATLALGLTNHFDDAAHIGALAVGAGLGAAWGSKAPVGAGRRPWAARAFAVAVGSCFLLFVCRERRDPYSTLGASERCDLASILIRSGQCEEGRSALDAATRLLPDQPTVMALESEWQRTCEGRSGKGAPRS